MDKYKDAFINAIMDKEGRVFTNNPNDSGGPTNYGITEKVARSFGYSADMEFMPERVAYQIYVKLYWDKMLIDKLIQLNLSIAEEVMDTSVNLGTKRAATLLQRCLNVFNRQGKLYEDVTVDGKMGPKTLKTLTSYLDTRSPKVLYKALNHLQGAFYIRLAEKRAKDEEFVYGWLSHRT